jgi:hypothetical protein
VEVDTAGDIARLDDIARHLGALYLVPRVADAVTI